MRRLFTSIVAVTVVLAFSAMASAQAKQASGENKPAAHSSANQSATPAKAKAEKASGTIKAASGTMLTLTTKEGDKEFTLGPKTVVAEGAKTLKVAELAGLAGQNAIVHYKETGGQMTVTKVTVAKPATKMATKKEAPKK